MTTRSSTPDVLTHSEHELKGPSDTARRVRVCLAALRFYPIIAGPAMRFQRYAPGLRRRGIDLYVFTCWQPAPGDPVVRAARSSNGHVRSIDHVNGIDVYRSDAPCRKGARVWQMYGSRLIDHCRDARECPNVIQFLTLSGWSLPALVRLRRAGVSLIFTQTMVRAAPGGRLARTAKDLLWRAPIQLMDRVIVSSGTMRDDLIRRGLCPPIEVIPNGVDLARFRPCDGDVERERLRHRLHIEQSAEVVLFIGNLTYRKGIDVLAGAWVRIARERPAARLVVIDPGNDREPADPSFTERVNGMLRRSGAWERVTISGPVDNVEDYLRAADVLAFPSRREGMPNVVPEAFATGLPVVLTPFTGLPAEFGENGREYLLVERTAEAMAGAVVRLLNDAPLRQAFRERGQRWAAAHLGVGTSLDRYAVLYHELASVRSAAAGRPGAIAGMAPC